MPAPEESARAVMNDERRYDEDEVDRIFQLATQAADPAARPEGPGAAGSGAGMTLRELQEIGEEVGIAGDVVARAASSLEGRPDEARKVRTLGVPSGVERTVSLDRSLVGLEWERLVARLRRTFRAQGRVEVMGGLRQWSNGNLQVSVEPSDSGYQLRMQTHKGSLRPTLAASFAAFFAAVFLVVLSLVTVTPIDLLAPAFLGAMGIGVGVVGVARLPGWAERRARQMDEIGALVQEWAALPPPEE